MDAFAGTHDLAQMAAEGHGWRLFHAYRFQGAPPEWVPILPKPGTYSHPVYGDILISHARNQRFVAHVQNKVYQSSLPVDLEHVADSEGAAGWIVDARVNADGSADACVEWTDRGKELLASDRFRYISPSWLNTWTAADGQVYEDVLTGMALCTRPFFKELELYRPLVASERGLFALDDVVAAANADGNGSYVFMALTPAPEEVQSMTQEMTALSAAVTPEQFADLQARFEASETRYTAIVAERDQLAAERDAARATAADTATALEATTARVAALEATARTQRLTALVQDGARWAGEPAKHVAMLERLATAFGEDHEAVQDYVQQQRAIAEQLQDAGLFREVGREGVPAPRDPYARLETRAKAIQAERACSEREAHLAAIAEMPEVYAEYSRAVTLKS